MYEKELLMNRKELDDKLDDELSLLLITLGDF